MNKVYFENRTPGAERFLRMEFENHCHKLVRESLGFKSKFYHLVALLLWLSYLAFL